ncbi:MAG TPA: DJ-1/PfpI family protein [Candidatus Hydrogenedentes bacterium]|nr:DJ-1/PfpI family protein [Candidatus Hydrogenedentota bacterium]HNT87244.1 DJ-1/PfpI family protein [Candidatus Hydrogenedentota bacterium]
MHKVLLVVGDGGEVIDTMVPYYRLGEDFQVVVAAPEKRAYHLVQHEHDPAWDITIESPGYKINAEIAFRDVNPDDYIGLVLPGGRAPEFLRYDPHLIRIVKDFFAKQKPVASICHGIEILATADLIRGVRVTTIPRCRFDAEVVGAVYVDEPLVVSGNLYCCRFKRECSAWMKAFTNTLHNSITSSNRGDR